jgi:ABC-type branched-subunit amino acid transport system substrate-binding protein
VLAATAYGPETVDFSSAIKRLLRFSQPVPDSSDRPAAEGPRRRRGVKETPELTFDFQAIFIPDEPKRVGMLASQLAYYDIKGPALIGTNLWHSEALIRLAQPYVEGALFPDAFFTGSRDEEVRRFVAAFEASYQQPPGFLEAIGYDTAMILLQTISRPDVRLRGDIAEALVSSPGFAGVTGFTRFERHGEPDKTLRILQVRGRNFVEID